MQKTQTAGVILIGDELLSGSIQDLNLTFIAKTLEQHGIRVRETRIVPDIQSEIVDAVNVLRTKFDYLFTTGGIGPTHDDITSDSIARAFNVDNVLRQPIYDRIEQHLKTKGIAFTEAAQRMAYTPKGAEIIDVDESIVPSYRIDNVYVMAGVPRIMQIMLSGIVEKLTSGKPILNKSVHANVGEGEIAAALEEIQKAVPEVDIGSYPQDINSTQSNYRVIFVVRGTESQLIDKVCDDILSACEQLGYEAVIP